MQTNEFHVNYERSPALDFSSLMDDICDDENTDERDEILDDLCRMSLSEFKSTYPKVYRTYFRKKLINSTRIVINYHYPLVVPIDKIHVSTKGFSVLDIATIIQKQYAKFFKNYEDCIANGQTPKYLSSDFSSSRPYWCIRFHINYKKLNMTAGTEHQLHSQNTIPLIVVRVDT